MPGGDAMSKAKMTTGFWPAAVVKMGKGGQLQNVLWTSTWTWGWNKHGRSRHLGNEQVDRTSLSAALPFK